MSSSRWKFKKHFRGTPYGREWLEREMMLLSAVKSHPINQCKVSDNLSKYHMRQAGTEDDIREVQGVFFFAFPDVLAGDRLFPISGKISQEICLSWQLYITTVEQW